MSRLSADDIEAAFRALAAEVLEVVLAFFPPERLPVRARLLLEEMFDDRG